MLPRGTSAAAAVAACVLLAACATAPKPAEVDALEQLRAGQPAFDAAERSPELVKRADKLLKKARDEWRAGDLDAARDDAIMGAIRLKTAIALDAEERDREQLRAIDAELARAGDDLAHQRETLAAVEEQVRLLDKLGGERRAAEAAAQAATDEQRNAAARDAIASAKLSLRTADTFEARRFAEAVYRSAMDALARAEVALAHGDAAAALTDAELARTRADEATATAGPLHDQESQAAAAKARNDALARDAASVPGVTVRLERDGQVTRLVLPLVGLFAKKSTVPAADAPARLSPIGDLLARYPVYSVEVVGHTDNRGRHDELVARSLARAQAVTSALAAGGADVKRFLVSGRGPDAPVADNKTAQGRAQNDRVEVVFLVQ